MTETRVFVWLSKPITSVEWSNSVERRSRGSRQSHMYRCTVRSLSSHDASSRFSAFTNRENCEARSSAHGSSDVTERVTRGESLRSPSVLSALRSLNKV